MRRTERAAREDQETEGHDRRDARKSGEADGHEHYSCSYDNRHKRIERSMACGRLHGCTPGCLEVPAVRHGTRHLRSAVAVLRPPRRADSTSLTRHDFASSVERRNTVRDSATPRTYPHRLHGMRTCHSLQLTPGGRNGQDRPEAARSEEEGREPRQASERLI